jgi:hypothetical protein
MELGKAYEDVLSLEHRLALGEAANELISTTISDLVNSDETTWTNDNWLIGDMLPPRYIPRYNGEFARKFFVCLVTVVWKLGQPLPMRPSCVAEELAVYVLMQEAEALAEMAENELDFDDFRDAFFEDLDFEWLYANAADGIESAEAAEEVGMVNLAFKDWFTRFGPDGPSDTYTEVHAYAQDAQECADDGEVWPLVRSKGDTAHMNEMLCKMLCHNICVPIQSMYELGIDSEQDLDTATMSLIVNLLHVGRPKLDCHLGQE